MVTETDLEEAMVRVVSFPVEAAPELVTLVGATVAFDGVLEIRAVEIENLK